MLQGKNPFGFGEGKGQGLGRLQGLMRQELRQRAEGGAHIPDEKFQDSTEVCFWRFFFFHLRQAFM